MAFHWVFHFGMLQEAAPANAAAMEAAAWEAARKVAAAAARGAAARRAAAAWEAAANEAARKVVAAAARGAAARGAAARGAAATWEAAAWEAAWEAARKAAWEAAAWEAVREAATKKAAAKEAAWEAAWKAVNKEAAARGAAAAWRVAVAAREAAAAWRAAAAAREAATKGEAAREAARKAATAAWEAAREAAALETTFKIEQQDLLLAIFTALWLSLYLLGGGTGSSSKKSLLAYDGWSEIWEIVLLKSGDVERNPGPTYITDEELNQVSQDIVGEDHLQTAFDEVGDVRSKWLTFCCCLGLQASLLEAIAKDHPNNAGGCLFDGLKHWVRKNYNTEKHGPPTWRKLVEAVDNSSGGENHRLALEIAERHKKSDPVQTTEENAAPPVIVSEMYKAIDSTTTSQIQRRSQKMSRSSAFKSMYRSVVGRMRGVDVGEIKASLCYLTDPHCPTKLCVPPRVYRSATTTKELLDRFCPRYVNPGDTFVLEEIVNDFGSRRCKKELKDYTDRYV